MSGERIRAAGDTLSLTHPDGVVEWIVPSDPGTYTVTSQRRDLDGDPIRVLAQIDVCEN